MAEITSIKRFEFNFLKLAAAIIVINIGKKPKTIFIFSVTNQIAARYPITEKLNDAILLLSYKCAPKSIPAKGTVVFIKNNKTVGITFG